MLNPDFEEADAQPQAREENVPPSEGAKGVRETEVSGPSGAEEVDPDEPSDPRKDAEALQTKRNA